MKRVDSPLSGGEPLDALLGAFFKGQMPSPWPEFRPPAVSRQAPLNGRATAPFPRKSAKPAPEPCSPRWTGWRSRLGLAASVALLALTALSLPSNRMPLLPGGSDLPLGPGDATRIPLPGLPLPELGDPQMPQISPDSSAPARPGKGKVKSSLFLEQGGDGRTRLKSIAEELPANP